MAVFVNSLCTLHTHADTTSSPNTESSVLPPVTWCCSHYRIEKAFALSGKVPTSMLGLSYVLLVFLTDIPLKWFTSKSICGMNVEVTGARILLSLSPPIP